MASKSGQPAKAENPEELLEIAEQTLDRLRVMYEQYFLGMQKQAPGVLHSEVERRIRDLQQANLRNTALRYRFATLQQKFGSYNSYWRRTLRQIENGTYIRNLAKIGRNAARNGADIPEEILAAMPKFLREQVQRDRAIAIAKQARQDRKDRAAAGSDGAVAGQEEELLDLGDAFGMEEAPMELSPDELADVVAMIKEPSELRRSVKAQRGPHVLSEDDAELDIDSFFAAVEAEGPAATAPPSRRPGQGVDFRSVTRATASPPLGAQTSPSERPSQALAAQTSPSERPSQSLAAQTSPSTRPSQQLAAQTSPSGRPSQPIPVQAAPGGRPSERPAERPADPLAAQTSPAERPSQPMPAPPGPAQRPSQQMPPLTRPATMRPAPSQAVKPNPIAPGAAASARLPVPVPAQPMPGQAPPLRQAPTPPPGQPPALRQAPTPPPGQPAPLRPANTPAPAAPVALRPPPVRRPRADTEPEPPRPEPPVRPPPGMTDADVNALYAKYVKAKEMVGEDAGPGARAKLLKTIHSQAPKIMEQYKAKGVDFQVVVKDNQVIIRAKPKP